MDFVSLKCLKLSKKLEERIFFTAGNAYLGFILHFHIASVFPYKADNMVDIDEKRVVYPEKGIAGKGLIEFFECAGYYYLLAICHHHLCVIAFRFAVYDVLGLCKNESILCRQGDPVYSSLLIK